MRAYTSKVSAAHICLGQVGRRNPLAVAPGYHEGKLPVQTKIAELLVEHRKDEVCERRGGTRATVG